MEGRKKAKPLQMTLRGRTMGIEIPSFRVIVGISSMVFAMMETA